MATSDRGFASMDPGKQREIASKGGKAAHEKGTAHEWTAEEAREAGRKGGLAHHGKRSVIPTEESIGPGHDARDPIPEIMIQKNWNW
jgi:general stress protein YciG